MGDLRMVSRKQLKRGFLRVVVPALLAAAVAGVLVAVRSGLRHAQPDAQAKAPAVHQAGRAKRSYYRVRGGDTLGGIAIRYRTSVHRLLLLNPGIDPHRLTPGWRLRVR